MNNKLNITFKNLFENSGRFEVVAKDGRVRFWAESVAEIVNNLVCENVISTSFEELIEAKVVEQIAVDYEATKELFNDLYESVDDQKLVTKLVDQFNSMIVNLPENLWQVAFYELKNVRDLHIDDHEANWKNFLELSVKDVKNGWSYGIYDIDTIYECVRAELEARGIEYYDEDVFYENQELFEENDKIENVIKTLADKVESGEIE
ncbi:MAG: hypothetical protein ACOX1F_00780 [Erysipelotrichaceae bacterium]|jgi:hypothetical protein